MNIHIYDARQAEMIAKIKIDNHEKDNPTVHDNTDEYSMQCSAK
jgi:hypothetical protein